MPSATCLINDNKKEYCVIYTYTPDLIGSYLIELEKYKYWNLQHDIIYVQQKKHAGYIDVGQSIPKSNNGGEIIHEYLTLFK
jgi:hypothetical protein